MSRFKTELKNLAGRFPGLASALRPAAHALINVATRDNVTWTKHKLGMDTRSKADREHDEAAARAEAAAQAMIAAQAAIEREAQVAEDRLEAAASGPDAPGIGSRAQGDNVLMLVISDLRIDPRVEREARALAAAGYRVTVLCPDPEQDKEGEHRIDWGEGVAIRFLDWRTRQFAGQRPGYRGAALFDIVLGVARALKPFAIHAHDLNTCHVARAVARQTGAHLVVDFHEWTSENVHWDFAANGLRTYPDDWKQELKALEHQLVLEASASITVSEMIAEEISAEIGHRRSLALIRNVPNLALEPTRPYPPLKQQLGLPDDRFLLLYQGGTGPTRLIEPIIEALAQVPGCALAIRGPSLEHYGEGYREIARRGGFGDRLFLMPPVPSQDVVAAARGADAGIWTLPDLCRNFSCALPNKIFEYVAAGLPVMAADYPEASRFVRENGIGLTFDPQESSSIASALVRLVGEPAFASALRANVAELRKRLSCQDEWAKLVDLYRLLPRTDPEGLAET
jgi:glycosyltransferase involved in cell wall biosynthesis